MGSLIFSQNHFPQFLSSQQFLIKYRLVTGQEEKSNLDDWNSYIRYRTGTCPEILVTCVAIKIFDHMLLLLNAKPSVQVLIQADFHSGDFLGMKIGTQKIKERTLYSISSYHYNHFSSMLACSRSGGEIKPWWL